MPYPEKSSWARDHVDFKLSHNNARVNTYDLENDIYPHLPYFYLVFTYLPIPNDAGRPSGF